MKISIIEEACKKYSLTIEEAACILAVKLNQDTSYNAIIKKLEDRKILFYDESVNDYYVRQPWDNIIEEVICDSSNGHSEERLLKLAEKIRECFPAGKQQRLGSPYYYRSNTKEIVSKLKKFFLIYGNFTDAEIIDATKRYVASFFGRYKDMRLAKYFILKDAIKQVQDENGEIVNKVEQVSDLATFLENKDEGNIENEDWIMNSKN